MQVLLNSIYLTISLDGRPAEKLKIRLTQASLARVGAELGNNKSDKSFFQYKLDDDDRSIYLHIVS